MTDDPNQAFTQKLRAIFADEAREHLRDIDTGLAGLQAQAPEARRAALEAILKVLHTLKGAARAVGLGDLEQLCHALEGVLAAAVKHPARLADAQCDLIHQAVDLARQLTGSPGGRVRNQAAALGTQLDKLGVLLLAPAPGADQETGAPAQLAPGEPGVPGAPDGARPERIRVEGRQLDAIRGQVEALLFVELSMRHQIGALRELAAAIAGQRRRDAEPHLAARPADPVGDSGSAERECGRLAGQLTATCNDFSEIRARLMQATLETALVPFASATDELPALVRTLARGHDKQAVLDVSGEGVLVDRRILPAIRTTLIHLVTNAVDHGIETSRARLAAGKPAAGRIAVAVRQPDSRQLLVRVSDDGAGIDADSVAGAALRQGALEPAQLAALNEPQRVQLALRAGVTTRGAVTPVSGRGMGLAIVAEQVASVGGELRIENTRGTGCEFTLLLPVTLSSLRGLVVGAGGSPYLVPLAGLESVRALGPGAIQTVEGIETVLAGERVVPLVRLGSLFGHAARARAGAEGAGVLLFARAGAQSFAMLADTVDGEQDVLPKTLGKLLRRVRYIGGAAQLGDGRLAPIVSLDDVARHALAPGARPAGEPGQADPNAQRRVLVVEDSITSRLLLKHILESAGCRVDTAVDGLDALSRLRQQRYDAVVSDVEMPHMDGLALTASIRADPASAGLPVILVTALQTPEQQERGLRAGADAYLTKGAFDQDKLLATIRRLIGGAGQ